jgi:hypothetical protein
MLYHVHARGTWEMLCFDDFSDDGRNLKAVFCTSTCVYFEVGTAMPNRVVGATLTKLCNRLHLTMVAVVAFVATKKQDPLNSTGLCTSTCGKSPKSRPAETSGLEVHQQHPSLVNIHRFLKKYLPIQIQTSLRCSSCQ